MHFDAVSCYCFWHETLSTSVKQCHLPPLSPSLFLCLSLAAVCCLSLSQAGVGAAAAQPAETHVAESQRPVPGVPAPPHEGHAEDRERAVIRAAPPGGGDEEERPGTRHTHRPRQCLIYFSLLCLSDQRSALERLSHFMETQNVSFFLSSQQINGLDLVPFLPVETCNHLSNNRTN